MTLPFALRPRIRLRDDGVPVSATRPQSVAFPIAAYWGVMGILTYGIGSHWLHPERWLSERPERHVARSASVAPPRRVPRVERVPASLPDSERPSIAEVERPVADPGSPSPSRFTLRIEPPRAPHTTALDFREAPRAAPPRAKGPRHFRLDPPYSASADPSVDETTSFPAAFPAPPLFDDRPFSAELRLEPSPAPRSDPEPPRARPPAVVASSCEAALERAHDEVDLSAARGAAPDLSRDAFANVLERGTYLSSCGIPDGTALELCVAVQHGRAVGITVSASPSNGRVVACVRRAVAGLSFPESAKLDVTRTRFERVR